jgi:hypothetical protein
MTFDELKTELAARGFDMLSDDRLGRYVNQAAAELDETELWPYREQFASGEAPLAIEDLGTIEQVINSSQSSVSLDPMDYGDLVAMYGDLSVDGTPSYYYTAWPSGVPTVATYPESEDTISVQYWAVSEEMSADADLPAAPARFHKLIVDMAAREAYRDSDNHGAAEGLQVQIDRDLARMRNVMFTDQVQGASFIRIVAGSEDW